MPRVEGEIVIRRPVEEVFDFVADERNEPRYNPRMVAAELVSGEPIGLGSRFATEFHTRGRTVPMTVDFTEFDRPRRLGSFTYSSMMDTAGTLSFEPAGTGTRMRWAWIVRPRGVLRLAPAIVGLIGRRQERSIWGGLKRLLECDLTGVSTVLVAYATGHGSTGGVAERVAGRLSDHGAAAEALPVDEVDDLAPYGAVILGSAVYGQAWISSATEWLHRHADALARRPVWLFSVGSFGDTHPGIGRLMTREPKDIEEIERLISPRGYRVFAGAIARDQWPPASRLFFHAFGGRFGDNRNWAGIDAWADSIAESLSASARL